MYSMSNREFIKRTGGPEVLVEVAADKKRFTDIDSKTEISSATLSNRLKEGKVEGLWEEQLDEDPDGSARRVYAILPEGRKLAETMQQLDIPELIEKRQKLRSEYDQRINEALSTETSTA